jgi:hypothetical protein
MSLRGIFGISFGLFVFLLGNIMLIGFGTPGMNSESLISRALFPIAYFIFMMLFLLIALSIIRSVFSSRTSIVFMLFLTLLMSISAAFCSSSLVDYSSNTMKLEGLSQSESEEIQLLEERMLQYSNAADYLINLSNAYDANNANLRSNLNQLKIDKANAELALLEREAAIEAERLRIEQMLKAQEEAQAYEEEYYYEDDYYEDD